MTRSIKKKVSKNQTTRSPRKRETHTKETLAARNGRKQRKNSEGARRRLANLQPFKPGESGNPNGRPKGSNLKRLLKDMLELETKGVSSGQLIVEKLVSLARRGNLKAIEIVLDRIEGKARQRIDLGGIDGAPIPISVIDTIDRIYGKRSGQDLAKAKDSS